MTTPTAAQQCTSVHPAAVPQASIKNLEVCSVPVRSLCSISACHEQRYMPWWRMQHSAVLSASSLVMSLCARMSDAEPFKKASWNRLRLIRATQSSHLVWYKCRPLLIVPSVTSRHWRLCASKRTKVSHGQSSKTSGQKCSN